ncbi:MAG: bifunctional folylpolyglutamate synthase/dihydrofolate synthase, partial [Chloroflexia bacterium]
MERYLSRYIRSKEAVAHHARYSPMRTRRLLDRWGAPDRRLAIVRVIGTKGKGSTAAMLEAVMRAAGYRTGLYTSPHLHTPRERIRVGGQLIARGDFAAGLGLLLPALEESLKWEIGPVTLFEGLTALAMYHFARQGVELAVVEAGMGGKTDATQALQPVLTLLTPISLDHQAYLGETLVAIAEEKVGAIPPGGTAASARQAP